MRFSLHTCGVSRTTSRFSRYRIRNYFDFLLYACRVMALNHSSHTARAESWHRITVLTLHVQSHGTGSQFSHCTCRVTALDHCFHSAHAKSRHCTAFSFQTFRKFNAKHFLLFRVKTSMSQVVNRQDNQSQSHSVLQSQTLSFARTPSGCLPPMPDLHCGHVQRCANNSTLSVFLCA